MQTDYIFTQEHTHVAKGVAILLMLIHHLFAFPEFLKNVNYISLFYINNKSIESIIGGFGKICVSMFLYLSGYGFYYIVHKNGKFTLMNTIQQLKKIMINYWAVFLIFVPMGFLFFKIKIDLREVLENILCISCSYNGTWWFMQLYIELLLIFPIVYKCIENSWFKTLAALFLLFIINILCSTNLITTLFPFIASFKQTSIYHHIYTLLLWQFTFFIGYIAAKLNLYYKLYKLINILQIKNAYIYTGLIILCIVTRVVLDETRFRLGGYVDWLLVIFFIFACVNLIELLNLKRIFICLGKHSMNIWLIHGFFCYIYEDLQQLVYYPKISILIFLWLVILSFLSSCFIEVIKNKCLRQKYIRISR